MMTPVDDNLYIYNVSLRIITKTKSRKRFDQKHTTSKYNFKKWSSNPYKGG